MAPPTTRLAARVVPVAGEVCLLLREQDPARPGRTYWSAIGGAVDAGEDLLDAAVRELREESGIVATRADLVGPIHREVADFSWNGVDYVGDSTYFALAADPAVDVSFDGLEPLEVGNVLEARWLTSAEARADGCADWPVLPEVMDLAVAAVGAARRGS